MPANQRINRVAERFVVEITTIAKGSHMSSQISLACNWVCKNSEEPSPLSAFGFAVKFAILRRNLQNFINIAEPHWFEGKWKRRRAASSEGQEWIVFETKIVEVFSWVVRPFILAMKHVLMTALIYDHVRKSQWYWHSLDIGCSDIQVQFVN